MILKNPLTFEEILESEYRWLVEGIEHGSSDPHIIKAYRFELKQKTGYDYKL